MPSPGLKLVADRSAWPDLKRYVQDIIGRFADDRRVLMWDLYNEPGQSKLGEKSMPLSEAVFEWARDAKPSQPLTVRRVGRVRLSHVAATHANVRRDYLSRLRQAEGFEEKIRDLPSSTTGRSSARNG